MNGWQPLKHHLMGPPQPAALVALFHGLGGSLSELRPAAERWAAALPRTAFLFLQAPDRDYFERELKSGAFSGDWYKFPLLRSAYGDNAKAEAAYARMVHRCINERCEHVSAELDRHLAELSLGNDRLMLAGFSQGAAISAYTGLRRRCLGILPLGGPCPPRPALMPSNDVTRVCAIVGDADHCAPHEEIRASFSKYPGARMDSSTGVHVIPNQEHVVSEASIALGLAFLRGCLRAAKVKER